jgi:small-conductance mechanosensitive channel
VRVHERDVFTVRVARGGQTPEQRARPASAALDAALEGAGDQPLEAHVVDEPPLATVYVGQAPVIRLGPEDAAAEASDLTVHVYAESVAAKVQDALRTEQKRSAIAQTVFSASLLVFSAVIALLLLRRLGSGEQRVQGWIEKRPERIPALRLGKIEVVSSAGVRGAIVISLRIGERLAQLAVAYGWLLFALSLFDATRGYSERLTGYVLAPVSSLVGRIGDALPIVVVGLVAALAVSLLVRFTGLFFGSLARGETNLGWLPRDLAGPTSVLVRGGIVVVSLIVAAPLLTGSGEGTLGKAGIAALVALGLACTPLLACAAVGVPIVFGRRLRVGDIAEAGGRTGRVRGVSLLELRLEDAAGCEVRVPHLLALWHPTSVIGTHALAQIEVVTDGAADSVRVEQVLLAAARTLSGRAKVELVSLDADGAIWRVSCPTEPSKSLAGAVAPALAEAGIALGRRRGNREP